VARGGGQVALNSGQSGKFLPVGKCSSKNAKFGMKTTFLGNLGAKLKLSAPIMSSVGNLQLSVRKLQLPAQPTFFNPRRQ